MPVYEHEVFIPLEPEAILWRYLDIEKFKSLLETKSLFFCRADKFSDPFEGSVPRKEAEYRIQADKLASQQLGREFNEGKAKENSDSTGRLHRSLKQSTIVNCWHINENESDAMWRLYLKDNEGVAIQTTAVRMIKAIEEIPDKIGISKIRYIDYENGAWYHPIDYPHRHYNLYMPLVHKRNEFKHENEFRLLIDIDEAVHDNQYWETQPNHKGKLIPVNLDTLIEKVYLPPTADEHTSALIKKVAEDLKFNLNFVQSKLSSEPFY